MKARTVPICTSLLAALRPSVAIAIPPPARKNQQPEERINAKENGAGGAGKPDVGQRVRRKRRTAQDDEVANDPGNDRDDRSRLECVPHKIILPHKLQVAHDIKTEI